MTNQPRLPKPEAMIFDMDGTLFKTETLLLPVHHQVFETLRAEKLYEGETPSEELMLSCLGMLLEDIWKKVIPDSSEAVRRRADELLLEYELLGLKSHPTELYPGVADTLRRLKDKGIRLFVASNGLEHYVKGVAEAHGIAELFEGLYSAGQYQTASKADLVRLLLDRHDVSRAWMIGDRSSDVEAGKANQQTVIGCAYAGFGNGMELEGSDVEITSFSELLELFDHSVQIP